MGLVRLIAVMTPYDPAVLLLVAIMYVLEVTAHKKSLNYLFGFV
jgi:hypothetical protein